jgi:hypothetical protein
MAVENRNHNFAMRVFTTDRSDRAFGIISVCFFLIALGVTLFGAPTSPAQAPDKWLGQLPDGEGKDIVATDCLLCHTLERVVISHRPHGEWDKLVNQMIERGAPLADDQVPIVVNYLAKNFGPGHVNTATPAPPESAPSSTSASSAPNIDLEKVQFSAVPDSLGLPKDIQISIITGDPTKTGPFSLLLKIPASVVIPPHWESTDENIVELRGTFEYGEGEDFDASKLQALKPQTTILVTAQKHNFGRAKESAIIMVSGNGPISFGHNKSN